MLVTGTGQNSQINTWYPIICSPNIFFVGTDTQKDSVLIKERHYIYDFRKVILMVVYRVNEMNALLKDETCGILICMRVIERESPKYNNGKTFKNCMETIK